MQHFKNTTSRLLFCQSLRWTCSRGWRGGLRLMLEQKLFIWCELSRITPLLLLSVRLPLKGINLSHLLDDNGMRSIAIHSRWTMRPNIPSAIPQVIRVFRHLSSRPGVIADRVGQATVCSFLIKSAIIKKKALAAWQSLRAFGGTFKTLVSPLSRCPHWMDYKSTL